MKIAVVGSGGREHALSHRLRLEGHDVVVSPGRAGIPGSTSTPPSELEAELFIIGPEQELVDGMADALRAQGKVVFGPGVNDARLEGSKIWMKQLLKAAGVPTAAFDVFWPGDITDARQYIRETQNLWGGWVIKTDGLAAGKGVLVTNDIDEAMADAEAKLQKGGIVVEQPIQGVEASFFAVCSGKSWTLLPSARDYKRLFDGDEGPNTGGMGSVCPIEDGPTIEQLTPIIDATLARLEDFRGVLFGGVMMTADGPQVLEYNIRFGDPEIQSIAMVADCDFGELLLSAALGDELYREQIGTTSAAVTIVLAAEGYPTDPKKGAVINGLDLVTKHPGVTVFHAGTKQDDEGNFVVDGGRVLAVTALEHDVPMARDLAYLMIDWLGWPGVQNRWDIALA